jgi:hypothetical protein
MNAIELLETQHRDVDDLFARLERNEGDEGARRKMFDDLADMLAIHATIEENHFYPALNEAAKRTRQVLEHSLDEHLGIKRLLAMCLALPIGTDLFRNRLRELEKEVHHHVEEERRQVLPVARNLFDADQLEALGQEMTSTMAQLQQGRPRFDVPLQTIAPMPLAEKPLPMQGDLSSRVMPRLERLLALPNQMLGIAKRGRALVGGFVRGVQRGMNRKREA